MTTFKLSDYTPAGPTIGRFHASPDFHRWIAGPIGSGKTTAAAPIEAALTAIMQRPDAEGVRRAKVGILRDTYRNMYRSLIPTWQRIFPPELGHFTGSDDRPAKHVLSFPAPHLDAGGQPTGKLGMCELEAEFCALGSGANANTVEAVCRGWEIMYAYIDEEDLVPTEARSFLAGRALRGGISELRVSRGVTGCFNKPDVDHPLYEICEERQPSGYFDQPGGLLAGGPPYRTNPGAENLQNLHGYKLGLPDPQCYYPVSAEDQPEWYIRRMLRNAWGASVAGEPIYLWTPERHVCAAELEPRDGDELVLGLDGGGTPAAVIMGRTATGRRVVYAEVVIVDPSDRRGLRLQRGIGPKTFAAAIRDALTPRFQHCRVSLAYGDPAAFYGADREAGEYSFMETVGNSLGITVMEAPSNEISLRQDAVRELKDRNNRFDGLPNLMINPSCRFLRRGFASDYKLEARDPKQPGKDPKPQKSATSHVHDALQYACLGDQGRAGVVAGEKFDRHAVRAAPSDPLAAVGETLWREHGGRVADRRGTSYGGGDFDLWRS